MNSPVWAAQGSNKEKKLSISDQLFWYKLQNVAYAIADETIKK